VASTASDPDLLALETETVFGLDERGRLVFDRVLLLTIGVAREGLFARFGATMPDNLVERLERAIAQAPGPANLEARPPALNRCQALIEPEVGAVDVAVDLCYVIPAGTRYDSGVEVVRSIDGRASELRAMNPGNWGEEEWDDLLDGKMGPWAMAVHEGRVISTCHTPVPVNDRAAEAGVWTDPAYRGRGMQPPRRQPGQRSRTSPDATSSTAPRRPISPPSASLPASGYGPSAGSGRSGASDPPLPEAKSPSNRPGNHQVNVRKTSFSCAAEEA
jgi:hypothetical protein